MHYGRDTWLITEKPRPTPEATEAGAGSCPLIEAWGGGLAVIALFVYIFYFMYFL